MLVSHERLSELFTTSFERRSILTGQAAQV
jgi:hypothetical protein